MPEKRNVTFLLDLAPMMLEPIKEWGFFDEDQGCNNHFLVEMYKNICDRGADYYNLSAENLSLAETAEKTRYIDALKAHILNLLDLTETQAAFHVLNRVDLSAKLKTKQDRHKRFVEILREKKDKFGFASNRAQAIERLHLLGIIKGVDYL